MVGDSTEIPGKIGIEVSILRGADVSGSIQSAELGLTRNVGCSVDEADWMSRLPKTRSRSRFIANENPDVAVDRRSEGFSRFRM